MTRGEFESVAMLVLAPFICVVAVGMYVFDRVRCK